MNLKRIENIKYDQLKGFEKAAILLNYLGPELMTKIIQRLEDNDIKKILGLMNKFRIIPVHITKRVLEEYYELLNENKEYIFSQGNTAKELITEALGEDRARAIWGNMGMAGLGERSLESLDLVDAKSLSTFLINEHPQTIAVILAHLEPDKKGEVIKALPESLQVEVVLRLSNLDHVAPELVAQVDQVLKNELSSVDTVDSAALGGVQPVAEMLNLMDKNTEEGIMSNIEEKDPILAEEIKKLMFVFEDLANIDDRGIQTLLKEIPPEKLLLALRMANDEVQNKIFKNLSQRAAELLKEDLDNMGPARVSDVEGAQVEIVNIARQLEMQGKIIISRGGSEDAMV